MFGGGPLELPHFGYGVRAAVDGTVLAIGVPALIAGNLGDLTQIMVAASLILTAAARLVEAWTDHMEKRRKAQEEAKLKTSTETPEMGEGDKNGKA